MSSPTEAPASQQVSFGLAPPAMRSSLSPSVSPQPDMQPQHLQASMLGRTPSGQLPSVYWDRKMASDVTRSGDTRTQLFVGNLPFRIRWQDLKDLFRRSGTVLRADVALTPENRSKGFGTVLFAHDVDAYRAIEMFNGFNWQSRILDVRLDHQDPTGAIALSMAAQTQPVGVPLPGAQSWQNIPTMMQPMPLGLHPSPHGSFHHGASPMNPGIPPHLLPHGGQSISRPSSAASNRGNQGRASRAVSPQPGVRPPFAVEDLQQARSDSSSPPQAAQHHRLAELSSQSFGGSMPQSMMPMMAMMSPGSMPYPVMNYYGQAQPQPQRASPIPPAAFAGRHLFVGNLPFNFQWQDLKDLFRQAGNILRADVTIGPEGRSRGFGTVLFASQDDAQTAVEMFNGYELRGRALKVHFDKFASGPDAGQGPGSLNSSLPTSASLERARMSSDSPSYGMLNGLGHPSSRPFSPSMLGATSAERPASLARPVSLDRPSSRNLTAPPGPSATLSDPVIPKASDNLRASISSKDGQDGHLTPDRPSSALSNKAADKTPERAGPDPAQVEPIIQPQMPQRQVPGPLHISTAERYSTGPAALMSPPAPMGTPGFHPFSPQTGRIAMTPSMPGFSFHPFPQTPPLIPHFLSPGLGPFSPPLGGGAFHNQVPSYLNPAPGAPIHLQHQMGEPQTPSLDHMMSGGYFNAIHPAQRQGYVPQNGTTSADSSSAQSSDSSKAEAPTIAEPSYFPPVETLLPKRRNSNSALGSPATLSVTTPGGDEAAPTKRSHSTVERSTGAGLDSTLERLSSLGISTDGSALSLEDGPDPNKLSANPANRRASLYENKRSVSDSHAADESENTARRASFEDNATKRKERVDFGKSIWS